MNTNPQATTILCYGDSNTWGQMPDNKGRYPANVRWTGKLQDTLGDNYYVIEEGLSGRTTDLDYRKEGRNGKTYLLPSILSHNPLGVVVIMLGTKDLSISFHRDAADVATALQGLIDDVGSAASKDGTLPRMVIMSPIHIDNTAPDFKELYASQYDHHSVLQSRNLAGALAKLCDKNNCTFLDASTIAAPGADGIHLSEESHAAIATLLANTISKMVK